MRTTLLLSITTLASAFHSTPSLLNLGNRASSICSSRKSSSCLTSFKMQAVDDKTEVVVYCLKNHQSASVDF